jgi:hypothetical protein
MNEEKRIEGGGVATRSGNPSPHQARMAKKQNAKPKDLAAVSEMIWKALERCATLLEDEDPTTVLKASHAVFQGATAYAKLYEVSELEARLEALEQQRMVA